MKQISSAITLEAQAARPPESATGIERSTTGSEKQPNLASDRLLASNPRDTDSRLAAYLAPSVTSCLGRVVDRYHNDRGEYIVESRHGALQACSDPQAAHKALEVYERACRPAPEDTLVKELGGLRLMTKSAQAPDDDVRLSLQAYARKIQQYPGDVALHVLRTQPDMGVFWPAWAELKDRLDLYAGKRLRQRDALRQLVDKTESAAEEAVS